jgi:hypothetical protein
MPRRALLSLCADPGVTGVVLHRPEGPTPPGRAAAPVAPAALLRQADGGRSHRGFQSEEGECERRSAERQAKAADPVGSVQRPWAVLEQSGHVATGVEQEAGSQDRLSRCLLREAALHQGPRTVRGTGPHPARLALQRDVRPRVRRPSRGARRSHCPPRESRQSTPPRIGTDEGPRHASQPPGAVRLALAADRASSIECQGLLSLSSHRDLELAGGPS